MRNQTNIPQFISVPFKADSPNGITEYNGIAKFSPAGIVVEFNGKFLGLIDGEVKEVQIALGEIIDINFRKGFFKLSAKIRLRLNNFSTLSRLPNDDGEVKLKIKRKDFEIAERAVGQTLQYLQNLQNPTMLPDDKRQINELPPTHTPISVLFDEGEDETKRLK